ncbi:nutritionally-regulated adipose and cardiac-enriched protein homolog isoform X2 [Rhinatrema bivittatum]|uniref:nutritionally-regulated adipose and cardiac-enriched protein homolog isoform X2 n=1 Tax=Rhinatrema bivittatum TaxID=194408 RepID=UPI00112A8AF6|nr:nutritionally-regulated adipose and cardiac-enriched protein homolog isoform X2 [Rhinatrema bivittatum]XP_029453924.1 nutritionally-regulated adipose and cardiac-enriched protein homolog isoform X2 [Rhinatrema bivittatum]
MYAGKKAHPPSILRKKPPGSSVGNQDKQAEKRVRFQDPEEIIVHDLEGSYTRLPLFLLILVCILLILAVFLCCIGTTQHFKALEKFHSQFIICLLQIRQAVFSWWTWFIRQ